MHISGPITAALLGFCSLAGGQEESAPTASYEHAPTVVQVIPFQLSPQNNIVVEAMLNETDSCKLMFHTAVESVSLTSTSTPKMKSVEFTRAGNTISWGGQQETRFSPTNKLRIGSRLWPEIAISEGRYSGIGTDGKFGWELFDGQIVQIDFDNLQLKTHSRLPDLTDFEKFSTKYDRGGMKLQCSVGVGGQQVQHEFLVHSGFGGTALFDDQFTAANKLHDRWKSSRGRDLKDSLGNVISTSRVLMPSMSFGAFTLKNIPAELFPGDIGSQKTSIIGGEFLKRFHVLVDAERQHIYLKPNDTFSTDFPKPNN